MPLHPPIHRIEPRVGNEISASQKHPSRSDTLSAIFPISPAMVDFADLEPLRAWACGVVMLQVGRLRRRQCRQRPRSERPAPTLAPSSKLPLLVRRMRSRHHRSHSASHQVW